jgi:phospholipase C
VTAAFTPSAPGARSGGATLFAQNSSLPLMTWYLSGTGLSSAVTIDPGTQSTIAMLSNNGRGYGSVIDGTGNVYVVDHVNSQVIELAAGTFMPATVVASGLLNPIAVALDGAGNLYISDTGNSRVEMVPNEQGTLNSADMSTVSLSGLGSPHGLAIDGSGNLYVVDSTNGDVVEVPAGGGTPAMVASGLTNARGVAVDAGGNVYVAADDAVMEYPFGGGTPIPIGSGYKSPRGLAVDTADTLYVADTGNGRIVEVAAGGASQSNLAVAGLTAPESVSVDSSDNLYVTNNSGNVYELNRTQAAPLAFGTANVGSTSASQTLTVSDAGNQQLTISNLMVTANFMQGPSGGTDCGSSTNLSSGGQCLVAVALTPMDSGTFVGTLTLTDNALNNTSNAQSVSLSGSGSRVAQMITFTTNAPATAAYNGSFSVAATAGSGLAVVFTSSGSCTNTGATYTMTSGTGACTVIANQPGNTNYSAAPQVTQSTAATNASQTITFTANAPATAAYDSIFSVAATASSGLAVVFTSSGSCTNTGATYTMTGGTGTCAVIANQPGNTNYSAAPQVTQSATTTQVSQTITFTKNAPGTAAYNSSFSVAATASSGLAVVFTGAGVCTNSGVTYTITNSTGTCTVIANQPGSTNYSAAAQVTQSTAATNASQTITFTANAPSTAAYKSSFTVAATASSGLAVVFTSAGVCTNSGVTYTITNSTGTCTVIANQPGNTNYPAAPQVTQSTGASKAVPTVTFTGAPATAPYESSFTVTATTNASTKAIVTAAGACSISGITVTMAEGIGTCTATAKWAADSHYLAASLSQTTTAEKVLPSIAWTTAAITYGTALSSAQLNATVNYNGTPLTGKFVYSPPSGKILAAGSQNLSVTLTPSKNTDYTTAIGSVTLVVNEINTTTTITSVSPNPSSSGQAVNVNFTVSTAYGKPTGTVAVNSSTGEGCTGTLTAGGGSCSLTFASNGPRTLTAAYSGDSNDINSVSPGYTQTVNPGGVPTFAGRFQHVVVIFQENRTPDNLFHGLPNADIANSGINSSGQVITLSSVPLANNYDLDHGHQSFVKMYDGGEMDGADKIPITCAAEATNCPPPNAQFMFVDPTDVQPYFQLAETYTFGDRMFQSNQGPSFPAHQFIISGTSAPTATSDLFAAENPSSNGSAGCSAPASAFVVLIDPFGNENQKVFPCLDHPTLMDLLDAQMITWRYYTPSIGTIWTGPNAIQHLRFGTDWANVIVPQTKVLTDIAKGQLAQVSWVIPDGADSDHPKSNAGTGPAWVASIVNAIGKSPYWENTAIIITWDDWGGWYDHVPPTIYNSYEYGFRVPLIIVSPYSKQAYVSHVTHDFGSILQFIEEVFNLPSLGYADARADDFSDCFELSQTPISFSAVPANLDESFFLTTKRPPSPPDDDGDEK